MTGEAQDRHPDFAHQDDGGHPPRGSREYDRPISAAPMERLVGDRVGELAEFGHHVVGHGTVEAVGECRSRRR